MTVKDFENHIDAKINKMMEKRYVEPVKKQSFWKRFFNKTDKRTDVVRSV